MKTLRQVLQWLEQTRKGYKYEVKISSNRENQWIASVTGHSYEDKSLPYDFVSVSCEDFDKLPEAVYAKSKELVDKEIIRLEDSVKKLFDNIGKLKKSSEELLELQSKL